MRGFGQHNAYNNAGAIEAVMRLARKTAKEYGYTPVMIEIAGAENGTLTTKISIKEAVEPLPGPTMTITPRKVAWSLRAMLDALKQVPAA